MNLPNIISLLRLLSVPLIVVFIVNGYMAQALLLFCLASLSDALDGFLARYLKVTSFFGACLDAVADKVLLVSVYITLSVMQAVPWPLTILVAIRDSLILLGTFDLLKKGREQSVRPLFFGKLSTIVQLGAVAFMLSPLRAYASSTVIQGLYGSVAVITFASGLAYAKVWLEQRSQ